MNFSDIPGSGINWAVFGVKEEEEDDDEEMCKMRRCSSCRALSNLTDVKHV